MTRLTPDAEERFVSVGGLYQTSARVHRPRSVAEVTGLFGAARGRLTLVGARRSFGEQFMPPDDAEAVDLTELAVITPRRLEEKADGSIWVAVPGSLTFEQLADAFPGYLPFHPPTGDRITIAGALAACTHATTGFFASEVRAFSLLTPDGREHSCHAAAADDTALELFSLVPGSFGVLGVITAVELRLWRVARAAQVEIHVLENRRGDYRAALARLVALSHDGAYPLGRGVFFFDCGKRFVLTADRLQEQPLRAPPLPLTDDATTRNIVMQALANRLPQLAQRLVPLTLAEGRRFLAPPYAFAYYQRSYERAYDYLSSAATLPRLLRALGVQPRLPVCHQTFVIPAARCAAFLSLYFSLLAREPRLQRRTEQEDLVHLQACRWPLHALYGMGDGAYVFSVSYSVRPGERSTRLASDFLAKLSTRAYTELGVKVLLLKQAHCEPELLRTMHGAALERLSALKQRVDPKGLLTSRFYENLWHIRS